MYIFSVPRAASSLNNSCVRETQMHPRRVPKLLLRDSDHHDEFQGAKLETASKEPNQKERTACNLTGGWEG